MNIIDTLIRLRDDLKEWVTNNILELRDSIPSTDNFATHEYVDEKLENIDLASYVKTVNCKVAYGTCSTAAATAEKTVVVENAKWELEVGSMVAIRFSATNSASNVTINVNGTGAYPIWASAAEYTSTGSSYTGYENRTYIYMFNGTHWVWISNGSYPSSTTNASLGHGYGVCSTAEATLAKTCTISSYSLSAGGSVSIKFTNAVPANSTLNIRTRGAKKIFYKGAAISDGVIKAGDTATFVYDGTQYQLISIDSPSTSSDNNTTNSFGNSELADTKLYLGGVKEVGTSSSSYDTSFVNPNVFIGTDNALYSENKKVATEEFVVNEIAKIDTSDEIVDSIEEMTNTNKQYALSSTNTWWRYKTETLQAGSVLANVNNAIKWSTTEVVLNKRLNSSTIEVDAPGCALFYFTFNDEMKNILNTIDPVWVRMKGCSLYATIGNNTSTKVNGWTKNGSVVMGDSPFSQILMYEETKNGISSNPYSSALFPYSDNKVAPVTAIKFGYYNKTVSDNSTNGKNSYYASIVDGKFALSLIVNFANKNPITEADLENVYITFNEPIVSYEEQTISEWYDTGVEYNPNADNEVVELQTKVTNIENRVEILESKSSTGGGGSSNVSTLPDYWISRLNDIGDKIDTLQKENGMDTLQFLWCSDIHGVTGTPPSNTTYIGEIGRYIMDKHNIPFFMVSGDIMSQGSHGKTSQIWAEYDKLIPMLSPIKNEEFLAIKGNHDGAWGSPMEYNGQANQYYHSYIGDKALFNAFMRRQTLDSHRRVFGKDGMYFYVDYHNYRIYMLNGHTFGDNSVNEQGQAIYNGFKHPILGSEQIQWIADTLNTVQENQQVIFVCHAQLNQQLDFEVFRAMLNHYKNRTSGSSSKSISGTYWGTDAQYSQVQANFDFTNAKGSIVGWFNGHIHSDSIKTDLFDNLPIFTITTAGGDVRDTYYTDGTLTRVKGSVTETAIDIVTITSDYIYFTRIGSGYDRKFNRASKEVTIDYDSAYVPPVVEPDEPPVVEPDEPEYASFVNLISANVSDYALNKKFSGTSIVDGGGYYLTPIYKFSNEKTPYLNIEGAYGAGAATSVGVALYKVAFYKGSTCALVEYTSNMGLSANNNGKQSLDMSKYTPDKYDGIQLLFTIIGKSSVATNDIPIDGTVKAVLAETPDKFVE